MKKKLFFITAVLIGILGFISCDDDDVYSLGDFWLTTGTINKSGESCYVTTDGGSKLWPSASNVDLSVLEEGTRVLVNYTVLDDATDNEMYDYYVRINDLSTILTKPYFEFTESTTQSVIDSIGEDPVIIANTWFTNDYLNVEFEYDGGSTIHYINLVYNHAEPETNEGEIILELKHNRNKDLHTFKQWGIASFDLSGLKKEDVDSVQLFIRSKGYTGQYGYNKVLTYKYGDLLKLHSTTKFISKDEYKSIMNYE